MSEHVETLVEIEEEYREYASEKGVPWFNRVPTVMTHPKFIVGLKEMILDNMNQIGVISGAPCPENFDKCCRRLAQKGAL